MNGLRRIERPVRALALLVFGFALVDLAPVRAVFDGVALGLAAVAAAVLNLGGLAVVRTGATLREALAGWGMEVTRVCDGHGLAVAAVALVAALAVQVRGQGQGQGLRRAALALTAGLAAIQLFNLLRILVLGLVLHLAPGTFEVVHLDVFPLLTAALFLLAAGALARCPPRRLALTLALSTVFSALWIAGGAGLAAAPLAGAANLILAPLAPAGIGALSPRPAGWLVETLYLAATDPVVLHRATIAPADFAIALPLLLAAALAAPGRAAAVAVGVGLAVMVLALALGAVTSVWAVTEAAPVLGRLQPQADGGYALATFAPPPPLLVAALRLAQNVLVHANLLLLPGLILASAARRPGRAA